MHSKTSRRDQTHSFLTDLFERGEEVVGVLLEDLMHNPGMRHQLGKSVDRAAKAKKSVDKNIQSVLSVLNLPSRADYERLASRIEALQGSIVNVNMKLDRLLARQQGAAPTGASDKSRPAARRRPPRAPTRATRGT